MIDIKLCDLCSTSKFEFLYHIKHTKPDFKVVKCSNCGLIFQNPRFSDEEIKSFYSKDYYSGVADFSYIDERENFIGSSFVWKKRINKMKKYIETDSEKKILLDIGCSFGGFLFYAQKSGFEPYGIDISDYSTEYAREKLNLKNIITGEFKKGIYDKNFFDAITMIEVIEHIKNPGQIINEVYNILKKGGLLVIQTANFDGLQAKIKGSKYHYFLPGHLFYFSKKTLTAYLKRAGFRKIKIFYGVDFGLLPKLLKSIHTFKKPLEYFRLFKISFYHLKSQIHYKNFALTSSMVIYAIK